MHNGVSLPDQIAGNSSIDRTIRETLCEIGSQKTADSFLSVLRKRSGNTEKLHIYHELFFGLWAHRSGFLVEYNKKIKNKTPDWIITKNKQKYILEVATIHDSQSVMNALEEQKEGKWHIFNVNEQGIFSKCYQNIEDKILQYKKINLPIIVGLCIDFDASFSNEDFDVIQSYVQDYFSYPNLCGVLMTDHTREFRVMPNLHSRIQLN